MSLLLLPGFALASFLFGSTVSQLRACPHFIQWFPCHLEKQQNLRFSMTAPAALQQHPPGDVEVVEQLSLVEALLQEPVALPRPHLGHCPVALGWGHVWPLHQTAYTSHAATGGERRGREMITEVLAGVTGQRKSLN